MRLPYTHTYTVCGDHVVHAGVEGGRLCLPSGEAEVYTSTLTSLSQVHYIISVYIIPALVV